MGRTWNRLLESVPQGWRSLLVAAIHILYIPSFLLLRSSVDTFAVLVGALVVVGTGWLLGRDAGVVSGLIIGALYPLIEIWAGDFGDPQYSMISGVLSIIVLAFMGDIVGRLHTRVAHIESQTKEFVRERAALSEQILLRQRIEDELRTAKEMAESASRAKSVFLANISHELRTPLTTILGYSEILQLEEFRTNDEQLLADLAKIHRAGDHLLNLVNGILDLSAIEANRMTLWPETFDLSSLIDDVVAIITPLAERSHNTLRADYPGDLGTLYADPVRVRQILLNLLANATQFTDQGEISLRVTRSPGTDPGGAASSPAVPFIIFEISDTGIGMQPEQIEQLFQPFFQMSATAGNYRAGSGLGLAISHELCRLMGGEMCVESTPGEGTTFTFLLPVVAAARDFQANSSNAGATSDSLPTARS